ncbi:ESX-1 secretion-associated protein [Mycobacteroides abscessus]|uniref:type VII secretion target n=1 Tax=Mycobacteroides abscessus TaxID=36809 RepID=UPI001D134FD5|nr:type VII secretion target [Mycobacteroides abscessus]UEA50377.1 ESX-1 secretion-associated protein [Mycobacteroides abscessus subsp. abscessus]UEA53815.1 ESX-1 secretion-associated protein [Mycobacteroides abscessus]
MANIGEPLNVDPTEMRLSASRLEAHAGEFSSGHRKAYAQAGQVVLGSGLAGAALAEMLASWETDGTRFGKHFGTHAEGHREAAAQYMGTDAGNAGRIGAASSDL